MTDITSLEACLFTEFPPHVALGTITPHECEECDAIRRQLERSTWDTVPSEFVRENFGGLPLLSQEAYVTYLPAWLRLALRDPSDIVATQLLVNLSHEPKVSGFTLEQRKLIVAIASFIVTTNVWGRNDPVNDESLAAIESAWG